ncbi:hypothetical protein K388_05947 [Streptomyces sp. KhCrAH-43]|uniref:hypothetical protein n=1 Tax=unclassified Streptomyces TaxID=2593676 RepID=UPI00037F4C56|nr:MULTISPECIES: hypothetical protein [unclassified Streptomyces]MYS33606.1 hypothetical protein [Streptomyces sp. SID4920]MYX63801.1 hypothetical protein [Streptomyces sp. SID8373]RAJ52847.1 hypothetical protein K388_05947 [Streptomyces sp. KhCrAH-43]
MSQLLEGVAGVEESLLPARRIAPGPSAAGSGEPRPVPAVERSRWLSALRLSILRSLTTPLSGRPRVALYVLVKDNSSAADRRAVAARAGFEVAETYVDDEWKADPAARFALARAYTALRRGEIHGLVAASRVDISSCDSVYEQELHRLRAAGGFLDLALDETCI